MRTRVFVARPMPERVNSRLSAEFDAVLAEGANLDPAILVDRARAHEAEALVVTSAFKAAVCAGKPPIDPLG